jgi:hypothetical protein
VRGIRDSNPGTPRTREAYVPHVNRPARSALLGVVATLAFAAAALSREPMPLRGSPLAGATGLRLVVADSPPFVFDVDTGAVTRLPRIRGATLGYSVLAVSQEAAVVVGWGAVSGNKQLSLVRARRPVAISLGTARDVVRAANGTGLWVTRVLGPGRCVLQRIGFDGRKTPPRPIACRTVIQPGGSLGLVVRRAQVIDPFTGRALISSRRPVLAVAGKRLLLTGLGPADAPDGTLALVDTVTGSERMLRVPNEIGSRGSYPAVDPRGRYIAIDLANPSWKLSGAQVLDVWVIDTATAAVLHVPALPAFVSLKRTSMQWTHDGRLVLLGEDDDRAFVAVWRPGQRTLPLKVVALPERNGFSDSFAPLR